MRLVLLGEKGTGKTSYVVGLYGGLSHRIYGDVRLLGVVGSVHVLNRDLERLGQRRPVARSDAEQVHEYGLNVVREGIDHALQIPDRSGEAMQLTINGREWDARLLADVRDADGLLLFVNPMTVSPGEPVGEADVLLSRRGPEKGDDVPKPWRPDMMPTDVRMVDILQEIRDVAMRRSLPVAVVVSAWDTTGQAGRTPAAWLEDRLPLLSQYLESTQDLHPARCFGVSVQGSVFVDEEDQEVPDDEPDPWQRALAVDSDGNEIALIEPISWLLGLGTRE